MHRAAQNGHGDVVELLLSWGGDVAAKGSLWGVTALHEAAKCRHGDVVELLLSRGADVAAKDDLGKTALHHVVENGHKDVVELLQKWERRIAGNATDNH